MRITSVFLKRPVTMLMIVAAMIIFGVVSYDKLPVDLLPDLEYPVITVTTEYPGASADEVEREVTRPLVSRISTVAGIKAVHAVSLDSRSLITARFHWGRDIDFASLYIREQADKAAHSFPKEVDTPIILPVNPATRPVMTVAVSGSGSLHDISEMAEHIIKPRLEQIDGVASAKVLSAGRREIEVNILPRMAEMYGIKLDSVDTLIKSFDIEASAGTIKKGDYRYSIKSLSRLQNAEEIRNLQIELAEGVRVPLSKIAEIREVVIDTEFLTRWQGADVVSLDIYKEYGRNTIAVSRAVDESLVAIPQMYKNLNVEIIKRQDDFILSAIRSVIQSLLLGALLAFIILYFFINDFRSSLIIGLSIPLSIIGTFTALYIAGVNINLMTLAGLALGVGMLVDNSIIALENIFRKRSEKANAYDSALHGTGEISKAITASTLTTIAVFLPIVYVRGVAAALFRDQALAVTFSLVLSLATALTVLPLLAYKMLSGPPRRHRGKRDYTFTAQLRRYAGAFNLPRQEKWKEHLQIFHGWRWWKLHKPLWFTFNVIMFIAGELIKLPLLIGFFIAESVTDIGLQSLLHPVNKTLGIISAIISRGGDSFNRFYKKVEDRYHSAVLHLLNNKARFASLFIVLIVVTFIITFNIERKLVPETETGRLTLKVEYPDAMIFSRVKEISSRVEEEVARMEGVESVYSEIGTDLSQDFTASLSTRTAELSVKLKPGQGSEDFINDARIRKIAEPYPLSIEREFSIMEQLIMTLKKRFTVKVFAEEMKDAYPWTLRLKEEMAASGFFIDPAIINYRKRIELIGTPKREFILANGLDEERIYSFVQNILKGNVPLVIKREGASVNIRTRVGTGRDVSLGELGNALYVDEKRRKFPVSSLLNISQGESISAFISEGNKPYVEIAAGIDGSLDKASRLIREIRERLRLPGYIQVKIGGEYSEMRESFSSLGLALLLSAFLIYMIIAAQFESLKNPFIIIFTLPLGLAGTVTVLLLFGLSVNIISIIGFIVLTGIIVNDAIVKVDRINQLVAGGKSVRDSILLAGRQRLRPIVMTTVTTVFGLLPMALMPGQGSELYQPLAIVIIGGETIGTFLTIFFIPLFYELLNPEPTAKRKRVSGNKK